jgi:hypothetical protein
MTDSFLPVIRRSPFATVLVSRAPATQQIDDQTNQQDEAQPAATDNGTTEVKTAAAEQEQKQEDQKNKIHGPKIRRRGDRHYGALPTLPVGGVRGALGVL